MEENTSFAPAYQEYRFEEDLLETGGITVWLKGIICLLYTSRCV